MTRAIYIVPDGPIGDMTKALLDTPLPPDVLVQKWADFCHNRAGFVFIIYEAGPAPNRWGYAPNRQNKRPFIVYDKRWSKLGASSTLKGAMTIANRVASRIPG